MKFSTEQVHLLQYLSCKNLFRRCQYRSNAFVPFSEELQEKLHLILKIIESYVFLQFVICFNIFVEALGVYWIELANDKVQ